MKGETKHKTQFLLAAGISLGLIGSLSSDAATDVSYTGDTTDAQHAQSLGANASSPGAYADVQMDYTIPDVVAIGIYTSGDITSTEGAALLAGRFTSQGSTNSELSISNETDILTDITQTTNSVDSSSNSEYLQVRGVVYSSSGAGTLTVEPLTPGSTGGAPTNYVNASFDNQTNSGSFDVYFLASFNGASSINLGGSTASITNSGGTTMDSNNQGTFIITGDVQENTVTNEDDTGVYEGGIRVTITSL